MENTLPSKKFKHLFLNLKIDFPKDPKSLFEKRYKLIQSLDFGRRAATNNQLWRHFKGIRVIHKINLRSLQTEYRYMPLHNIHLFARKSLRVHSLYLPACNFPGIIILLRTVNQLKHLYYGSQGTSGGYSIDTASPRGLVNALRRSRLEIFNMGMKDLSTNDCPNLLQCCRYPSTLKRLKLF